MLLAFTVEDVAVVDGTLQTQQPHFAEAAFALAAVDTLAAGDWIR